MIGDYRTPTLPPAVLPTSSVDKESWGITKNRIVEVFNEFGIGIKDVKTTFGPVVDFWEIIPTVDVRMKEIQKMSYDIELELGSLGIVNVICPVPRRRSLGIEIVKDKPLVIPVASLLNNKKYKESDMELPCVLGLKIGYELFMFDLIKMPHVLIASATGQGKTTVIHTLIASLLCKKNPKDLQLVLIDPKKCEFYCYESIATSYLFSKQVLTETDDIIDTLGSLYRLMDERYDLLKIAGVHNIQEYNELIEKGVLDTGVHEHMPYIVVVIDEFGDLIITAGKEPEYSIVRIAELARAVGIHMIIATQRPTANIITGSIKANFPCRIALRVATKIDSRTILDKCGANNLVGHGDMLFLSGLYPIRIKGALTETKDIEEICKQICQQYDNNYYCPVN